MSDTARDQAIAQMESVARLVAALDCDFDRLEALREEREDFKRDRMAEAGVNEACALHEWSVEFPDEASELEELEEAAGEAQDEDDARERLYEDPLEVSVRSGWVDYAQGDTMKPEEFRIVLCTGGPHVELQGDLDQYGCPSRVRCLYRDWSECGELFDFDHEAALRYAQELIPGQ